jgi:hypothetical protein
MFRTHFDCLNFAAIRFDSRRWLSSMTVKMPVYLVYLKDRTFVFERLAFRNPLFVREVFQC